MYIILNAIVVIIAFSCSTFFFLASFLLSSDFLEFLSIHILWLLMFCVGCVVYSINSNSITLDNTKDNVNKTHKKTIRVIVTTAPMSSSSTRTIDFQLDRILFKIYVFFFYKYMNEKIKFIHKHIYMRICNIQWSISGNH